ncbi:MAG: sugar transferase [Sphingomonadaceae bacterium]
MYDSFGKRVLDLILASSALLALAPLMIGVAALIRLTDQGPALFRQTRIGRGGTPFEILKFRSMPVGTGQVPSDRIGTVAITPFGVFIRRTNIDELPQLFNILRGEMTIVGPRPPLASQADLIAARTDNSALALRPGLTGLAQINSFDGMSVAEKAGFDGDYARSVTLFGDLAIIMRTIGYLAKPPPKY